MFAPFHFTRTVKRAFIGATRITLLSKTSSRRPQAWKRFRLAIPLIIACGCPVEAAVYPVGTIANLTNRINSAQPGDQIILSNGVYSSSGTITISRSGTASQPILIAAQSIGGAQIGGVDGFNLVGASYVIIQGFDFTYTNSGTQGLIVDAASTHCRITRNIFETDPVQYWCFVQGDDTEVDHNLFRNKAALGEYVTLDGNHTTLRIAQRLWAHDNDFFNNHYSGSNGGESTRLGIGIFKLISAWSVVENNLYEHADGDPESISVKTSDDVIRYNTFTNCVGEISLRQGCRSRVEGNFSFNTGGMKFYADDHLIINNYFQGVTNGVQFGAGEWAEITDSDNNASGPHAATHRARVEFNTLVNCPIYFDWNNQGTNVPTDCIVANNILQGNSGYFVSQNLLTGETNFTWQTNIFWGSASTTYSPAGGYLKVNPLLTNNPVIPYHIASNSPAIGASYAAPGEVVSDMDGQPRSGTPDIGADEYSSAPVIRHPLGTNDVGPYVNATNFAIVAMPWIQTVMPGNGTSFTNLISAYNGFTNTVTLTVTNLPTNASASFNPASVAYGTNGFGSAGLSVTTSNTTPPGRYTLLITATSTTFTNTTIACLTVGNLPTNWTDADIGQPAVQGSADYYLSTFAVKGGGGQIYGASDQFNFAYQPWTNGLTLTARVITQPQTSASAESGVMIRETTNAGSRYVDVVVTPNSINMEARTATGGGAVQLTAFTAANSPAGTNSPSWVRLIRSGNTFTGYASSNGVNWVQMGTTSFGMTNTLAGLAVCAYDNTQLNTSTFDNVNVISSGDMPVITNQPAAQVATLTSNPTFTVGSSGTAPLSYQWRFNTNTLLTFGTNATLSITNVQGTNAGTYSVVITNSYGSVTSTVATLTINYPPSITNEPANQIVASGNNASFTVGASGTAPLSYQWFYNTNALLAFGTNATLTITNTQTTNAGTYSVVITNSFGSVTSVPATLTISFPPVIANQPTNLIVASGNNAAFIVSAGGATPLSYQWYFNTNTLLAGDTNSSLTIANAQGTNAGTYSVVITNSYGSVTSAPATLTIIFPPVITNQPASQIITISNSATFTVGVGGAAPFHYQWYFNTNTLLTYATNASLTITNAQSTNAGTYSVVITNVFGTATSAPATLAVNLTHFTNSGAWTWTCPSNVISVQVECWGGGGAGGSAVKTNSNAFGGGGAGGAYAKTANVPVTAGNQYVVMVGAGGISITNDRATVAGGFSAFSYGTATNCLAGGGVGGVSIFNTGATVTNGTGGTGGSTGCIGDAPSIYSGGNGANGIIGNCGGGGGGGAGDNGNGGNTITNVPGLGGSGMITAGGVGGSGGTSNAGGTNGVAPGGGGGGARSTGIGIVSKGGTGGDGLVILTYYPAPTVTASAATAIGTTNATLNGSAADNGFAITQRGFFYRTASGVTTNDTKITAGSGAGAFTATPALNPNTNYFWRAYAINAGGTVLSAELSFSTIAPTPPVFTNSAISTDRLSFTLTGTGAANQTNVLWMATNLSQPLTNWLPIATNVTGTNGVFSFTDAQITNSVQRFYRAMSQ